MDTQVYRINIRPGIGIPTTVHVSQYDVGRPLAFHLYDGTKRMQVPSGATVKIHATKPNGLGFEVSCTVSGSVATVLTTAAMTEQDGTMQAELVVTSGSMVLGTANFEYHVEKSPHPTGTIDGNMDTMDDFSERLTAVENTVNGLDAYVFTDPESDGNIIVSVRT